MKKNNSPAKTSNNPPRVTGFGIIETHSGPLPSPSVFSDYDKTLPGAAERILSMTEQEQAHRHEREKSQQNIEEKQQNKIYNLILFGQISAFMTAMTAIVLSFILIFNDKPVAGFATFFSTLAAFMAVYLRKTKETRK